MKCVLDVPTSSGTVHLEPSATTPLFILGHNGTGKSALMHSFVSQLQQKCIYIPGARPSYFENESRSLTPAGRKDVDRNLKAWDLNVNTRWSSTGGTSRNESAIHDLTIAETKFKVDTANEIKRDGPNSPAMARLQNNASPLDRANALLELGGLPVKLVIDSAELETVRDNSVYSIAKMSDGERIALVLIATVIAAPDSSIFLIDEPEVHLHRAIVVPLITSLLLERPDSVFVISTHELELVATCADSTIAVLRGCTWENGQIKTWSLNTITDIDKIPEDIRISILGSRQKLLFVEGISTSLDNPIYSLLFPRISVRSKESCREVERAVTGLRATTEVHHTEAFGMIDNDGMSQDQVSSFEGKGIYPLPVHSVESLYYSEEVLRKLSERQAETLGIDPDQLLTKAKGNALAVLDAKSIQHLASRLAERQMRDSLLQQLPNREQLIAAGDLLTLPSIPNPFSVEVARLNVYHSNAQINEIISRYPVRESSLMNTLAKGLRFSDRADYERAALHLISIDEELRISLCAKLGILSTLLQ